METPFFLVDFTGECGADVETFQFTYYTVVMQDKDENTWLLVLGRLQIVGAAVCQSNPPGQAHSSRNGCLFGKTWPY